MLKPIYIVLQAVGVSLLLYGRAVCSEMLTWWGVYLIIAANAGLVIKTVLDEIAIRRTQDPFEQAKQRLQTAADYAKAHRDRQIYRGLQLMVHRGIASPNTVYHRVRDDGKIEAGVVLAEVVSVPWYLRCWWTVLQKSHEKWEKNGKTLDK